MYSYTLVVSRNNQWYGAKSFDLTDSSIRGLYSAQILARVYNPVGPKFRLFFRGMIPTDSVFVTKDAYNSLLQDITAIYRTTDASNMYHIIVFANDGSIQGGYDTDAFTSIVVPYNNPRYGVKVVASNETEFMDGFLLYHRLMYEYSDAYTMPSYLLRKATDSEFYSSIYPWLFSGLPSAIQDMIISYSPHEFRSVNRRGYGISFLLVNPCEFAPWAKILKELESRITQLEYDNRVLAVLPKDTKRWNDPVLLLQIFLPYYPKLFEYVLKTVPVLNDRITQILVKSLVWNLLHVPTKSVLTVDNPDEPLILENVAMGLRYLLRRKDFLPTADDIVDLVNTNVPSVLNILLEFGLVSLE